jgi:hypothetical protein
MYGCNFESGTSKKACETSTFGALFSLAMITHYVTPRLDRNSPRKSVTSRLAQETKDLYLCSLGKSIPSYGQDQGAAGDALLQAIRSLWVSTHFNEHRRSPQNSDFAAF